MPVQQVLYLLGGDVLALADDDVLQPPGEHQMAALPDMADIAGDQEALRVEHRRRRHRVQIARADGLPAQPHLAVRAARQRLAVLVGDPDLHARGRTPLRPGEVLRRVLGVAHRDHGDLGHPVPVGELDAHLPHHRVVELRRFRRPAARQQPQGGDRLPVRRPALLGQEHRVEGRGPARDRHPVAPVLRQRAGYREVLEQHRGEPVQQQHHRVVRPADMGEREGHRTDVVRRQPQRVGQAGAARDQAAVGVQHPFGSEVVPEVQ